MNNIKSSFSIKDLENLTGIKAHTIRIWEKRYNLLNPERTETNIRCYSLESLQLLLNVSFLYDQGYKISKIANLAPDEIPELVKEISNKNLTHTHAINAFKLAMLNFDQKLFNETYLSLEQEKGFLKIFYEDLIPLMSEIGMLWQTSTITPAHEHFLTTLIRQKLLVNTEAIQFSADIKHDKVFVLYLPDNEVHELGLMLVNYELLAKGYKTIYLGQSVPIDSLRDLQNYYHEITFLSYFTIKPEKDLLVDYINEFKDKLLNNKHMQLWVLGRMLAELDVTQLPKQITPFTSISDIVKIL